MPQRTFGPAGGSGGEVFEPIVAPEGARITAVRVWSGLFVDSIQIVYRDAAGQEIPVDRIGGHSGIHHEFNLEPGEYLVGVSGRHGNYVDSLRLHTNHRSSETYGGWGGATEFSITAPADSEIVGFSGRAGWYIDALGIVTRTRPGQEVAAEVPAARKPRSRKATTAAAAPEPAPAAPSETPAPKAKRASAKAKAAPAEAPIVAESRTETVDVVPAAAKSPNRAELEKVEGIGPKLAQLLIDNGINDLADLAATSVAQLQEIVATAGARYKLADPSTWPAQAALGAQGDWEGFARLQAELKGGRKR